MFRQAYKGDCGQEPREDLQLQATERGLRRHQPCDIFISNFKSPLSCEKINVLSYPACGSLSSVPRNVQKHLRHTCVCSRYGWSIVSAFGEFLISLAWWITRTVREILIQHTKTLVLVWVWRLWLACAPILFFLFETKIFSSERGIQLKHQGTPLAGTAY